MKFGQKSVLLVANISNLFSLLLWRLKIGYSSSQNSPQQSTIAKGFAEANSVFIVITLAKILPRWLFPTNIYIQFTIFNTYFSTKLSFTNKRYHLHVLKKYLYVPQKVRSITNIHPLSLRSHSNGTSFAFILYIIISVKFCDITFLNNFYFYFVSFFYHLIICQHQRKKKLVTLSKSYLYKFFFWNFFLLKLTFNKTVLWIKATSLLEETQPCLQPNW